MKKNRYNKKSLLHESHSMKQAVTLLWFRQDLRLEDNLALSKACQNGPVLAFYYNNQSSDSLGQASKVWLHHSLEKLEQSLQGRVNIYQGSLDSFWRHIKEYYEIKALYWNRSYEPWLIAQEKELIAFCDRDKIPYQIFQSNYLFDPEDLLKNDGSFYKVFTPFKNKVYSLTRRRTVAAPSDLSCFIQDPYSKKISELGFLPNKAWGGDVMSHWNPGEKSAYQRLKTFLDQYLAGYKVLRDHPSSIISRLSPHLHFGEISPNQICDLLDTYEHPNSSKQDKDSFRSELIWREFGAYLLYYCPCIIDTNIRPEFNSFGWTFDRELWEAWKKGQTGYPLVDAGMRELWQTGYMHNRVRMIVASFLVKNLNIHWHYGRDWFWDCLLDADLGSNSMNWQWVAGTGVDASPYFRIFNPTTQAEKFDPLGEYIKRFVPELKNLPSKYLFEPWNAPVSILRQAGIVLDQTYPRPIIDLAQSRKDALERYGRI